MTELTVRTLNRLAQQLRGRLSVQGDEDFAAATAIWAKPTGRLPRAVVHCRTPEDVQLAIRAARDCDLPLSVRGGGHDWAGRALCDGIVIDLSRMNQALIGDENRIVRIAGGARASDVTAVTDAAGLAVVTGSVGAVGMTGLTLGGGYGPLIARFGLALDNLTFAEVVLADGRIVAATYDQERELFWALRGGGGNFGVVTAMHHRVHPVPSVRSGLIVYPFAEAKTVLERAAEIASSAPDALTIQCGLLADAKGTAAVLVVPTWSGDPDEGEAQIAPLLRLGSLLVHTVSTTHYGVSLAAFDNYLVNGHRVAMDSCWIPELFGHSIDMFIAAMEIAPSAGCAILTHELRGAAERVPVGATAFGLRRRHVLVEMLAVCPGGSDTSEEERHREWALAARQSLQEIALPGSYPNMLAPGDVDRARKAFGSNLERLLAAKRRYDPDNVFNSTIPLPAASATANAAA